MFLEPKNGATVTSPVHMKFGSSGTEISAVPAGDVKTARPGMTHYHVGVGVNCLPPGKNIVKGTPSWVHFGDGKSEIDMQLTPGRHKLALQLGDDLHNTVAGRLPDDYGEREIALDFVHSGVFVFAFGAAELGGSAAISRNSAIARVE